MAKPKGWTCNHNDLNNKYAVKKTTHEGNDIIRRVRCATCDGDYRTIERAMSVVGGERAERKERNSRLMSRAHNAEACLTAIGNADNTKAMAMQEHFRRMTELDAKKGDMIMKGGGVNQQ